MIDLVTDDDRKLNIVRLLDISQNTKLNTISGLIKIAIEISRLQTIHDEQIIEIFRLVPKIEIKLILNEMISRNCYRSNEIDLSFDLIDDYTVEELKNIRQRIIELEELN